MVVRTRRSLRKFGNGYKGPEFKQASNWENNVENSLVVNSDLLNR